MEQKSNYYWDITRITEVSTTSEADNLLRRGWKLLLCGNQHDIGESEYPFFVLGWPDPSEPIMP